MKFDLYRLRAFVQVYFPRARTWQGAMVPGKGRFYVHDGAGVPLAGPAEGEVEAWKMAVERIKARL